MSPILERLAAIELFSQLSAKELRKIASFMTLIKIKAGRDLTVQGTPGREFMIIVEGEASVRRNGRLIASLGPGDFFGELAVVAGLPRTATVTAESEMLVETLNRRDQRAPAYRRASDAGTTSAQGCHGSHGGETR